MTGMSNYLANKILDHTLRGDISGAEYDRPAEVYLALHSTEPNEAGVGGELSGGGYSRQPITFAAAADGSISNSSAPVFNPPTTTIRYFSIWDDEGTPNCLFTGSVGVPQPVTSGDTYSPLVGALRINKIAG